jgi:hypothetical protein
LWLNDIEARAELAANNGEDDLFKWQLLENLCQSSK